MDEFGEFEDSRSKINPHTTNQSIIMDDVKDYIKQINADKEAADQDRQKYLSAAEEQ